MANGSGTTVSAELDLHLVVPEQIAVPLVASLSYRGDDPYAVSMAFHVGTDDPVEWIFARELLADPGLPRAFKSAEPGGPDPQREELAVLMRTRKQLVDRHRRLLNETEALIGELPSRLIERLPSRLGPIPPARCWRCSCGRASRSWIAIGGC